MKYSSASKVASFLELTTIDKFKLFLGQTVNDKILSFDSDKLTLKSLNGYLIADFSGKTFTKVINSKLEPHFLKNELFASKILKSNTPKLLKYTQKKDFFYVTHELMEGWKKTDWKHWPKVLQDLTPILAKLYLGGKVNPYLLKGYSNQIKINLKVASKNNRYLKDQYKSAIRLLNKCLDKYLIEGKGYLVFQHGDLVPNNVFVKNNKYYIIDWTNGGRQCLGYDLMIQAFYFSNNYVWKNFDKINFSGNADNKVFFGWTKSYFDLFESRYNLRFTDDQIKLFLILALCELTLKNFSRYQTKEEYKDGVGMLENVVQICKNILNS